MTIITVLDTETTGLKQEDGHKIIEIALLSYDYDSQKLVDSYVQRIDPKRAIDEKAKLVHGISLEMLQGMPVWEDVAETVSEKMSKSDCLIAHNFGFDGPFILGELVRVNCNVPTTPSFCTMENGRWATFNGKLPKLSELCFALGVNYDQEAAHAADYDTDVTAQCLFKGIERGFFKLPI